IPPATSAGRCHSSCRWTQRCVLLIRRFPGWSTVPMYLALFDFSQLVDAYGYWSVFVFVALGTAGIPFPGSAVLVAAAVYAGATHQLNIALVIAAGAAGAIVGSSIGYGLGRGRGYSLLLHYGHYVRLDERRLKTGYYLSTKHGGKVLFFGRFLSLVRPWVGFFAGVSRMGTARFVVINVSGAILWASVLGLGAYLLGNNNHRVTGP